MKAGNVLTGMFRSAKNMGNNSMPPMAQYVTSSPEKIMIQIFFAFDTLAKQGFDHQEVYNIPYDRSNKEKMEVCKERLSYFLTDYMPFCTMLGVEIDTIYQILNELKTRIGFCKLFDNEGTAKGAVGKLIDDAKDYCYTIHEKILKEESNREKAMQEKEKLNKNKQSNKNLNKKEKDSELFTSSSSSSSEIGSFDDTQCLIRRMKQAEHLEDLIKEREQYATIDFESDSMENKIEKKNENNSDDNSTKKDKELDLENDPDLNGFEIIDSNK
jgi:hypothetical protein